MSLLLEENLLGCRKERKEAQRQIAEWLGGERSDYTHAVTLTFPFEVKNGMDADRYIGTFSKFLNKKCFRRAECDSDRLKMAIVFEGIHYKENIHAHCAIRSPDKFTLDVFDALIRDSWKKAVRNNEVVLYIRQYENSGWIDYFSKQIAKTKTDGISQYCNF